MERLWIKKGNPTKVIESSNVHYFYWPIELGFGSLRISRLKIPTFPVKFLDYEPVKLITVEDQVQVVSRFHYRILLYFNRPTLVKERRVVDFSFGSHSPFIHSDGKRFGSVVNYEGMDSREIDAFVFLNSIYGGIMSGKLGSQITQKEIRDYQVVQESVPNGVALDTKQMRAVIWVGDFPQRATLPSDVKSFLFS